VAVLGPGVLAITFTLSYIKDINHPPTMQVINVTIEAIHNNRVTDGLFSVEGLWTCDEGFSIIPGYGDRDRIVATLEVDEGRYDAEGDSYIADLLNVLRGDLVQSWIDE